MADDCKESPQCSLDPNGCLKLSAILRAFNAPVSEEQAWAVCFQAAKCIVNEWNSDFNSCYCLTDTSHILIHKDGYIHRSTVKLTLKDAGKRKLARSEYVLVHDLGVMVYRALDFGLCPDEERKLSPPLEFLIDRMTSACAGADSDAESDASQNADEGIEQDSGEDDHIFLDDPAVTTDTDRKGLTLVKVMEMCSGHLSCPGQADSHYKAVCRALVAEILELSTFLGNISNKNIIYSVDGEADCQTLENLKVQDWARLWMQVIQQLRHGVKLKKVDPSEIHPFEYALTPYEMLLDDIRSRRYKLRQVMVNGDIPPRVKKDAHALILEFIRSRPPLVPVSNRKLPPTPPKQLTLYEKLMASIKQQHKLKPTAKEAEAIKRKIETSRTRLADTDDTPEPHRRLIKADLSLLRLPSSFEDDDIDDIPPTPQEEPLSLPAGKRKSVLSAIVRSNSFTGSVGTSERRNSISVCESPPKPGEETPGDSPFVNGHFSALNGTSSQMRSDYWKSSQWQSLECLSLTLEEVVHIRSVLTKAELESLLVDPCLYEDILKGKICFTCKQVRFSFFGPWGVKCKMCERTVCDKCSSKMRIPTEHFARIPVYMLSPTPSPPPEEESSHTFWKFSDVFGNSIAPDADQITPKLPRQTTVSENCPTKRRLSFRHSESVQGIANKKTKNSTSTSVSQSRKRVPLQRSKTVQHPEVESNKTKSSRDDKVKGPMAPICRECKVMVCNIISASQDKVNYDLRRKRNSKTWPLKRQSSGCMTPVSETAPSSPELP